MKISPTDPLAARAKPAIVRATTSTLILGTDVRLHVGNEPSFSASSFASTPPLSLVLPYPPTLNKIYGQRGIVGRNGRVIITRFKTPEHRAYFGKVSNAWRVAQLSNNPLLDAYPTRALLRVTVRLYRPRRIGDIDNRLKTLFDALTFDEAEGQPGAWFDDEQIEELHAFRFDDKENPRVEVDVQPLAPSQSSLTSSVSTSEGADGQ